MSKCGGKKTNNRENWTGGLVEKMSGHEGIDNSEELLQMELYKTPLKERATCPACFEPSVCLIDSRSWWW